MAGAGLGRRLANSWRDRHYPNQKLDAASLVYAKAPQIIRAFDEGGVIRSRRGRFLAIPTENAPKKGTDGKQISRHIPRASLRAAPVCAAAKRPFAPGGGRAFSASFSRKNAELRGFRRATDRARARRDGLATVVMFVLVPQVKLRKRLDVARSAQRCLGDRRTGSGDASGSRYRRAGRALRVPCEVFPTD